MDIVITTMRHETGDLAQRIPLDDVDFDSEGFVMLSWQEFETRAFFFRHAPHSRRFPRLRLPPASQRSHSA